MSKRKCINLKTRYYILEKYHFTCINCGFIDNTGKKLEVDHIVPLSKGGSDNKDNYQILCNKCNTQKSNKLGWEEHQKIKNRLINKDLPPLGMSFDVWEQIKHTGEKILGINFNQQNITNEIIDRIAPILKDNDEAVRIAILKANQ